jgi:hypothetical protein
VNTILIICTIRGNTPLYEAANHGKVEMCKLLVSARANPDATDRCDAIALAMRARSLHVSHALPRREGFTVLYAAELYGSTEMSSYDTTAVCKFLRRIGASMGEWAHTRGPVTNSDSENEDWP